MKTLNPFPLDLDAFRGWLHTAQRPGNIAGIATNDTACPLSSFLHDTYGFAWAVHFADYERIDPLSSDDEPHRLYALPAWARAFVRRTDLAMDCETAPVPFEQALLLLDEACFETQKEV
ncbi:MAG: hypothetical protein ABI234_10590 [Ktedonobacteraceae bacterium]